MDSIEQQNRMRELPEEVRRQLAMLGDAESNLLLILAGILLRFQTLGIQKEMLLDSALCPEQFDETAYPDLFSLQVLASLITLCALVGFYGQAEGIAAQAALAGGDTCQQDAEASLSLIIIAVSLVRFALLLENRATDSQQQVDVVIEDASVQ